MRNLWASAVLASSIFAADATQDFQARLLTPLASYSRAGTAFRARVIGQVLNEGAPLLSAGTVVRGSVRRSHTVGFGIRRERAVLELRFDGCALPDGTPLACTVELLSVDNARESVRKNNHIRGVLAASHPHAWLSGLWYRPGPDLFHRSAFGLTGAGGMIYTRVVPSPAGAIAIIASRLILFRMPDPEIELPRGTDLVLRIAADPPVEVPSAEDRASAEDILRVRSIPSEVAQADGTIVADLINVIFSGSKKQLIAAFLAAGWSSTELLTAKTFARTYAAFATMKTYPNAPVSPLFYQDRLPDLVFQKSFNSLAKRHHIRIWEMKTDEGLLWLGAATHDITLAFDWARMIPTHRIDLAIDKERSKVVNDLADANCLSSMSLVARPEIAQRAAERTRANTDGDAVVVHLKNCSARDEDGPALARPRRAIAALAARRLILETRYYLTRGNAYYWAYQTGRWGVSSLRKESRDDNE